MLTTADDVSLPRSFFPLEPLLMIVGGNWVDWNQEFEFSGVIVDLWQRVLSNRILHHATTRPHGKGKWVHPL